jgi:hypothetical protein
MSTTRKQLMALIVETMVQAMKDGRDPWKVTAAALPGTPRMVLGEAYGEASCAKVENWWDQIERTIDGEVIRSALQAAVTP